MGAIKDFISKDTLTIAGGAVLGDFVTNYLVTNFGPIKPDGSANTGFVLPGLKPNAAGQISPYPVLIYAGAIPLAASVLTHKFSPALAKGLMIGGATSLMKNILVLVQHNQAAAGSGAGTAGTQAYLRRGTIRALPGSPPGYSAVRAFGGALDNSNAFKGAWSR